MADKNQQENNFNIPAIDTNTVAMRDENLLRLLLEVNQKSDGLSESQFCNLALNLAVEITNSRIGYLHYVNDDQDTVSLITWNKDALEHCTAIYESHYPLSSAGIWADSARMRRPVIHNDYQMMPGKKSYPEGHAHLIRHMSVAVAEGTKVRMIIGVGNKEGEYDESDAVRLNIFANEVQRIYAHFRSNKSLQLLTTVIEQSDQGIIVTDAAGIIVSVNGGFTKITGFSAEEALGKSPGILTSGKHDKTFFSEMWASLDNHGRWQGQVWNRRKNSELFLEWLSISRINDHNGCPSLYVGIFSDITKREEEADLLKAARDAAEEASNAKSTFIANMSHELRTPLNAVIGYADLMMNLNSERGAFSICRNYANEIILAGHILLDMINNILSLAEGANRSLSLTITDFDPRLVVTEAVDSARTNTREISEDRRIDCNLSGAPPTLRADRTKILQALVSIIENAIKFTVRDKLISVSIKSSYNEEAVFIISDSGIGMSASDIEKAVAPFIQVDSSLTKKYGGIGLGLPLSNYIVMAHGGKLVIDSAPGVGTTVTITIPFQPGIVMKS